jgi:hypothetical protein
MPKKKAFDGAGLIKMVEDGVPRPEIMKKFKLKTSSQLTLLYAKAQMEAGKIAEIVGGRGGGKSEPTNEVQVGKRGSLIIPKGLVENLGLGIGDKFAVRKTKAGISLKKL